LTDGGGQRGHGGPTAERVRLPVATARARLCALVQACDRLERVAVEDAVGRVTAEPVAARFSVPHFHASAMDGIAVRAAETAGATGDRPLELARAAGAGAPASGAPAFAWVDTGNPLPEWADAVVMVEAVEAPEDEARSPSSAATAALPAKRSARRAERVRVRAPATPWQHVRVVGEDVVAGEEILPAGHRIRPPDVGLLLATGVTEVVVRARPRVAILPTGDELIEPGADRVPGKTIESNSRMIAAWVSEWGGEPSRLAPAPDDPARLAERLRVAARDADLVCVLAGSSAGSRDYTAEALGAIGNVFAHGIELVPGRPTILASLAGGPTSQESPEAGRARVAIGIPGYPVAAAMVCRELVQPLVARLAGTAADAPPTLAAVAAEDLVPRPGAEELVRVDVGKVGERLVARPLARGAAALASLSRAGGLVRLRPGAAPIAAGERVDVELLVPASQVAATVLVAGFADPALGALERVARAESGLPVRIAVRSLDAGRALDELRRGVATAAVIAVDASADGSAESELRAAARATGIALEVLRLAGRDRGLVVAPGNPLGVRGGADATRPGLRLVPALKRAGAPAVAPALVPGASRAAPAGGTTTPHDASAELPPLALAAAVASGLADVAPGIAAAASAAGADFVALARQDVWLVLRADLVASEVGAPLVRALPAPAFRRALADLPGYDAARSGERLALA